VTVGCSDCGRVRCDDRWSYWDMAPGVMGICPTCLALRNEAAELNYISALRRANANKARGFGPAAPGVDVFAGFKE
jgi:hypothetical protein